jgi:hypothetical protein
LDWQVVETEHFRIFFHQGLEGAAAAVAQIAEEAYGPVTSLYGYAPEGRVRIVLKDHDDYANGAAFFYHDAIEIWATALDHDFELRGTTDWLRNVVTHEFTHIVSLGASRKITARVPALYLQYFGYQREKNRPDILIGYPDAIASYPLMNAAVPMWFAEGVAQYMAPGAHHDRWDSHRDMVLRTQVLAGQELSLERMGVFGKYGLGNEYVYDHGYGLTRYIAQTYGEEKLAQFCRAASEWGALEMDGAFRKVLGLSAQEVHAAWVDSLRRRYQAQVAALGERRQGELVAEVGFSNRHPALSPDGRKLAYLSTQKRHYGPHLLVVRDLQSGEEEVLASGVAASSLSWSPDGKRLLFVRLDRADKYGSRQADVYEWDFAIEEPGWMAQVVWTLPEAVSGYAPESPRLRRLSQGLRALYPAYSPDGEWIAFVRNEGGSNNLGLMRRDGSGVRYLTDFGDGTELYTPRWSPDGRVIALSVARQGQRDLALVRLDGAQGRQVASTDPVVPQEGMARLEKVVATEGADRDPTWSADGRELVFSSDFSGIFNIYALGLESGQVRQLTNVVGGAFNPVAGPGGEVVFSAYAEKGFELRKVEGEGVVVEDREALEAVRPAPPWMDARRAWPELALEKRPYGMDFLRTLLMPRLSIDEGHFKPGLYASSGDVLNRQNVFAGAAWAPENGDRDLFAVYEYRGWRPTMFLEFFNQRRHSARGDSSEARDLVVTGVNYNLNQISLGARGKLGRHGELALSATYDRYDASIDSRFFDPQRIEWTKQKPIGYTYLNGFGLGLSWRLDGLARRRDSEISPLGRQLYFRYDRMFNFFIERFDQNASFIREEYLELFYNQFTLDWNEYVGLPRNTRLGLRLYGGWIASDRVDDKERVNDFFDYHLGGLNFMKGYTFYSVEGRKAMMGTATLRFPLLSDMGSRFLHLYFDKVYGAVYGDIGKAWDGKIDEPDAFYGRKGPLRDVGGQLRFDLISYYSVPTRVQADLAYGIDEVEDRSPWKFYLTVLFGYL